MEWREIVDEANDLKDLENLTTMQALRTCGLLKYWLILGMKTLVDLMTWLVRTWNFQEQCFMIKHHHITIGIDGAYFLTGLSR